MDGNKRTELSIFHNNQALNQTSMQNEILGAAIKTKKFVFVSEAGNFCVRNVNVLISCELVLQQNNLSQLKQSHRQQWN